MNLAHRASATASGAKTARLPQALANVGSFLAAVLFSTTCLYPMYALFVASLKAMAVPLGVDLWPAAPSPTRSVELVLAAWGPIRPDQWLNTLPAAATAGVVALFLGVTADYAFGRTSYGTRPRLLGVLGATIIVQVTLLAGLFESMRAMHLYNHWWGLAMPYLVFTLPFTVWAAIALASPPGVPSEAPASSVDPHRGVWSVLPPALLVTAQVAFIAAWNELMYALIFVLDGTQRSLPTAVSLADPAAGMVVASGAFAAAMVLAALAAHAILRLWRNARSMRR